MEAKKNTKSLPIQAHKISTNLAEVKILQKKDALLFDDPELGL